MLVLLRSFVSLWWSRRAGEKLFKKRNELIFKSAFAATNGNVIQSTTIVRRDVHENSLLHLTMNAQWLKCNIGLPPAHHQRGEIEINRTAMVASLTLKITLIYFNKTLAHSNERLSQPSRDPTDWCKHGSQIPHHAQMRGVPRKLCENFLLIWCTYSILLSQTI